MGRVVLILPDELHEQLRADADVEGRTLTAQIRHLLAGGRPPRRKSGRKAKGTPEHICAALATGPLFTDELAARIGCHPIGATFVWSLRDMLDEGLITRQYRRYRGYQYRLAATDAELGTPAENVS